MNANESTRHQEGGNGLISGLAVAMVAAIVVGGAMLGGIAYGASAMLGDVAQACQRGGRFDIRGEGFFCISQARLDQAVEARHDRG